MLPAAQATHFMSTLVFVLSASARSRPHLSLAKSSDVSHHLAAAQRVLLYRLAFLHTKQIREAVRHVMQGSVWLMGQPQAVCAGFQMLAHYIVEQHLYQCTGASRCVRTIWKQQHSCVGQCVMSAGPTPESQASQLFVCLSHRHM